MESFFRAICVKITGLTGAATGREFATVADVCVKAPSDETYLIQELHRSMFHSWCLMLEDKFTGKNDRDNECGLKA